MTASPLAPAWLRAPEDANELPAAVWPAAARRREDGVVELAGLPATELAREFGTPLYVLDEGEVRARARRIREAFEREFERVGSGAVVYYAGKAFLSTAVARWVVEEGLRIDVASGGELAVALAADVDPGLLGMHGNNKSDAELDRAARLGLGSVVIDSLGEVDRVADAAARAGRVQRVRLRINSGVHASTHEYLATAREDQKFGVALADAPAAVAAIRARPELEFAGLHSHIGSQIFESAGFAEAARRLLDVHARLLADGPVPELNLGGGFGIAYTGAEQVTPIERIAADFAEVVAGECAALGIPLPVVAIEPGRAVVGPAGVTLYEVGEIKDVLVAPPTGSDGAAGPAEGGAVRKYVSVDGGMSDNIRTALYAADYSVRLANRVSAADPALVRVVGKHCESGDIVVRDDYLPADVARGDLAAVPATGAYCASLANNYNQLPRPAVVAVRNGEARVIVRRETEEDLLRRGVG